jgi:hypothetical protein
MDAAYGALTQDGTNTGATSTGGMPLWVIRPGSS